MNASTIAPTAAAPLTITRQGRGITLHALELDGPRAIGTYRSAAEAWTAIDELDMSGVDQG